MDDLVTLLRTKNNELSYSIKQLRSNGEALAKAEMEYKMEMNKEAIRLRAENMPVTLIEMVIHGQKTVAEARFKRDIAQVMYDTNQEHINATKIQIKVIDEQIKREWGRDLSD